METVYLVALLVGGVFVALSLFGGGHSTDAGAGLDHGGLDMAGADAGGLDPDVSSAEAAHAGGHGPGLADLLSLRFLFLFAAFFGLTGLSLHYVAGEGEPFTGIVAALVGLLVGMGGNFALRRFSQERVSSQVTNADLVGRTARVAIPFEGAARGQVMLVSKGQRLVLPARSLEGAEGFARGDDVVVVRMNCRTAEVVRVEGGLPEAPTLARVR
jgi:membrane protein implicated in regulation of membrane protease activity